MSRDYDSTTSILSASSAYALYDNAQPFTAALWIAPDSLGEGSSSRLVCKERGATGRWVLLMRKVNTLQFFKDYVTTDLNVIYGSNVIRTDGTFQHVALTWTGDSAASSVKVYVNGNLLAYGTTANGAGSVVSDASQPLVIGNEGLTARTFDGRIAHFHFFRRVLAQNEVRELMLLPAAKNLGVTAVNTAGLVAYFAMQFTGSEVNLSGNATTASSVALPTSPLNPPTTSWYVPQIPTQGAYGF